MSKENVLARVTVYGASEMKKALCNQISAWLWSQARDLMHDARTYPKRYSLTRFRREDQPLVRFTVYGAAEMSRQMRHQIAAWLRRHSKDVIVSGEKYSPRFIARFYAG